MSMRDFHEQPFRVGKIEDKVVPLIWPDGDRCFVKLRNARIEHARMGKALAEYDAHLAEVVEFKRRRGGHAAS